MQFDVMIADQHAASGNKHRTHAVQAGVHHRKDIVVNLHQTTVSVLHRFTITKPAIKTTMPNAANTPIEGHSGSKLSGAFVRNMARKRASIPQISGLTRMIHLIQPEGAATGNSPPETSN